MKSLNFIPILVAAFALATLCNPSHASQMDKSIESSAKESYAFTTYLQNDDIKIESNDGAVTMTGIVSSNYHKELAQETVASLPGVKSVDNRLELKGAQSSVNSDTQILDKVVATLLFHRSVSPATTELEVKEGVVVLRGEASSQAQKELATEYAKDVDGVTSVNNEMTVSKNPKATQSLGNKIDDASITAQVKITLLYHRSTSAISTKVETKQGVVSLYGKARNASEIDLATKLASDVNGVQSVKNLMTTE